MRFTPNDNICEPAKPITTDWKSIKWNKVNRHVTSLQRRIYRASRNNDRKKVRDLQRQLMRSNSALLIAIKRVTQINKGKYTPGIDGFRATSDRARGKLYDMLRGMKMNRPGEKLGYIPNYTRTDLTDALHETAGFRTDYEIVNDINMKRILRQTKGKK